MDSGWSLHPQLERDTVSLGDLALSRVLVNNDANYPWLILVPRRPDLVELIDLDDAAQAQLMTDVTRVGHALREVTACHKLNVAALGNMVPQLHVHVIAVPPRRRVAESGVERGAAARVYARRAVR